MRIALILIGIFLSFIAKAQYTPVDSTYTRVSLSYYNQAGYYIGKDSFHRRTVRYANCGDTITRIKYDTLIQRFPQRFITMDSIVDGGGCEECGVPIGDLTDSLDIRALNYLKSNANDTVGNYYTMWVNGANYAKINNLMYRVTNGTYIADLEPTQLVIVDGSNKRSSVTPDNIQVYEDGYGTTTIYDDHLTIDRALYSASANDEVPILGEVKDLISDSIATRPTLATVRNEISDSLAAFTGGGGDYIRKDQNDTVITHQTLWKDGTNETNITNDMILMTSDSTALTFVPNSFAFDNYNTGAYSFVSYNRMQIERSGYIPTASYEVPVLGEVKALINDSLDTRLASYTDNTNLEEKIEDKIGDKLLISGGSKSYNDATGETTLTITASGLTAEQVLDTVANTIQVGDYLKKTKDDSGDSLYIELLLKDAYKVVWGSNYWKSVWFPTNTTSGTQTWGIQWNNTGTVTAPTKSTTNKFQFFTRAENLQTTNSTTNVAGIRPSATVVGFGNSSGLGGFYMTAVWGPATGCSNSTQRGFFGMSTSTSNPTDVDPSTLTNIFGMGWDDDDTNVQFMHNDGSGTATKVDLGSSFPVTSADRTDVYRITMYSPANSSTVYYKIEDIKDGDVATGTVSSDLPSNTVFFAPRGYTSVGGTNTVTGFAIMQLELFSEY